MGSATPAASNDAARIRSVHVAPAATVHRGDEPVTGYADWARDTGTDTAAAADTVPGLPATAPWWLFVNDGAITEMSLHPEPIRWARSTSAWPALQPGCCDQGDVAPPSPYEPWPADGWPAPLQRELPLDRTTTVVIMPMQSAPPSSATVAPSETSWSSSGRWSTSPTSVGATWPRGGSLTMPTAWWYSLEVADGRPVLYVHAGLVAG